MKITLQYETPAEFTALYSNLLDYLASDKSKRRGVASVAIYKRPSTSLVTYFKVTRAGTIIGRAV